MTASIAKPIPVMDKAALNIRGYLLKHDPDYVPEFDRNMKEIAERHEAFWREREQERVD